MRCSSPDPSASRKAARCRSIAPWVGARPKLSAPRGRRFQTPALGGCVFKSLQWLRYLTAMFPPLNCNHGAKPLQRFEGASSKCSGLGAQAPRFRAQHPQGAGSPGDAATRDATRYGELQLLSESEVLILGVVKASCSKLYHMAVSVLIFYIQLPDRKLGFP